MYESRFKKDEKAVKLPYEGSFYIQEEDDKFVVYIGTGGSKIPEFYKEVYSKKEALKEFQDVISRATKGFKRL